MTESQNVAESRVSAALIRLLLCGEDSDIRRELFSGGPSYLIHVATRHTVLLRVVDGLKEPGPITEEIRAAADAERTRIQDGFGLIERIARLLERAGVRFAFPKAFQHLPDMGHDVDLLVDAADDELRETLGKDLHLTEAEKSVAHRFAGKRQYTVDGWTAPLEIHHGRLGHLGEHAAFARLALADSEIVDTPVSARQFSPEHQLILQALQRMYGHFGFRVTDIVAAVRSISNPALNWNRVESTAGTFGILSGVKQYLASVDMVLLRTTGNNLPSVPPSLRMPAAEGIEFRNGMYRPSMAGVTGPLFARTLLSAVRTSQWESGLRIMCLPTLAAASWFRQVTGPLSKRHG